MPFEETPIGHMIGARELADKRVRRSSEVRVVRELAAVRRWRRAEQIAGRLRLHRLTAAAHRAALRHSSRAHAGQAGPATVRQHTAWW